MSAVPGSVLSEKSKATNWLIQQGAKLTATVDDILEELSIERKQISDQTSVSTVAPGARRRRKTGFRPILAKMHLTASRVITIG